MLVLSRKIGETLKIGDNVAVTIAAIKGNQVKVAINAPRDIEVHREEIYQRIQHERQTSTHKNPTVLKR
ncbi:carbon storage regulator CsrA [uncultured Pseudoteredinibacter sp.]|uniref:carbon storage regulator CsrA n=1 Tax=uncultured Pseudoteredinibacter sp. TaxID=1641701 RepID=UPI002627D672|nr:carbon storage regulator CsrA [uncultured Pseudoteredinibacter sp.]